MTSESIEFHWNPDEFQFLLDSCHHDDGVQLSLNYLSDKDYEILEAGCGSGRVVKYLSDMGFNNVHGIELNHDIVRIQNAKYPELDIQQGDILDLPYGKNFFDIILSYGVIEHFPAGLEAPLRSFLEALKPNGVAVVTVPSLNKIRQAKLNFCRRFHFLCLKENNNFRRLLNKPPLPTTRNDEGFIFTVDPQFGDFYQYILRPEEFEGLCENVGFEIIESIPISHIDGLYRDSGFVFRKLFLGFNNWSFQVTKPAFYLNSFLKKFDFFHNHMHACVLRKPAANEIHPLAQ